MSAFHVPPPDNLHGQEDQQNNKGAWRARSPRTWRVIRRMTGIKSPLEKALIQRDLDTLKEVLEQNVNVNELFWNEGWKRPLEVAISFLAVPGFQIQALSEIALLLEAGARVGKAEVWRYTSQQDRRWGMYVLPDNLTIKALYPRHQQRLALSPAALAVCQALTLFGADWTTTLIPSENPFEKKINAKKHSGWTPKLISAKAVLDSIHPSFDEAMNSKHAWGAHHAEEHHQTLARVVTYRLKEAFSYHLSQQIISQGPGKKKSRL